MFLPFRTALKSSLPQPDENWDEGINKSIQRHTDRSRGKIILQMEYRRNCSAANAKGISSGGYETNKPLNFIKKLYAIIFYQVCQKALGHSNTAAHFDRSL